jgi:hypothetical protein
MSSDLYYSKVVKRPSGRAGRAKAIDVKIPIVKPAIESSMFPKPKSKKKDIEIGKKRIVKEEKKPKSKAEENIKKILKEKRKPFAKPTQLTPDIYKLIEAIAPEKLKQLDLPSVKQYKAQQKMKEQMEAARVKQQEEDKKARDLAAKYANEIAKKELQRKTIEKIESLTKLAKPALIKLGRKKGKPTKKEKKELEEAEQEMEAEEAEEAEEVEESPPQESESGEGLKLKRGRGRPRKNKQVSGEGFFDDVKDLVVSVGKEVMKDPGKYIGLAKKGLEYGKKGYELYKGLKKKGKKEEGGTLTFARDRGRNTYQSYF